MSGEGSGEPLFAPQRWHALRDLLARLEPLSAEQRARELDRVAVNDADLAQAARDLLDDVTDPTDGFAFDRLLGARERTPADIGPFHLLRRLGEGGMGTVYLAERRDTDFTQRVALKLLDRGMSNAARFAALERRVLASLAHPNITAFVDAGAADDRVWLAMEYVDGEPLLDHCRRHGLGARERVRLLDQVCAAVAHAHGQLVVHRDLKPSNVLVTSEGTAKLLDFGIASALDPEGIAGPATRVFTPEYAAPEQLRGERATAATDVHGLGLMLYELVADQRLPLLERTDSRHEWSTGELVGTVVRESGRATTDPVTADAARREYRERIRLLRGDIGRIIIHALAPDPTQRYVSVSLMREDLRRWLEHRPLGLERPSLRYLAARFARRHRAAVAVGTVALAALLCLSGIALWQAHRAEEMAGRADRAREFLSRLFANADPFAPRTGGRDTVDLLHHAVAQIESEFSDTPLVQAQLRATVAAALSSSGDGQFALGLLERSVAQLRALPDVEPRQLGATLVKLALGREEGGDIDGAQRAFEEAHRLLEHSGAAYADDRIGAITGLAKIANLRGDHERAHRMHEEALQERVAREGPESAEIAMDKMNLAADELYAEHYARAEALAQEAHAMLGRVLGTRHPRGIYVDNVLGLAQSMTGHYEAAITTLRAANELARATLRPGSMMIGTTLGSLGAAQYRAGEYEAAVTTLREACKLGEGNPRRASSELILGLAELRADPPAALATLRAARAHLDLPNSGGDPQYIALADSAVGAALAASGAPAEGARLAREARVRLLEGERPDSVRLGDIDVLLAGVLERIHADVEARQVRAEALAVYRRVYGDDHPLTRRAAAAAEPPMDGAASADPAR